MIDLVFLLNMYSWAAAGFIMIFMIAIAIFYQKKFGVRTFYYLYFIPLIVLFVPAFRLFPFFTFIAESIELLGSAGSFLVSYHLYRTMVGTK